MKQLFILSLLFFVSNIIFAQAPSNDNCSGAQPITVPTPSSCPNGNGATVTVAGTTVNATESNPYPYMTGCSTGGTQRAPALDVWYSFVATGTILNLNIISTFPTPNIGLWRGNCTSLIGIDCAKGNAAGNLSYTNTTLIPGATYFIQVSGNTSSATGTFDLTIDNDVDCNSCLTTASFAVSPAPVNGTYQAGQTVQICFTVNGFNQTSLNWLHGIEYSFGPGWNLATLIPLPPPECSYDPTPGPGNQGAGTWGWYNSVTSAATGTIYGPGFYFDNSNVAGSDPGQNFGDPTNGNCTWTFCISLQVSSSCIDGQSLNVTVTGVLPLSQPLTV